MSDFTYSSDGPVATLTLTAPHRHNALTRDTIAGMEKVLKRIDVDRAIRVLVLAAEGRSFCAGVDLGNVAEQDWTENPLTGLCDRLEALRPLTICAMQGGVYGGGVELAIACDFRIGVKGMKMFVPPAELGIHYPSQGIARAERLLGLQLARRVFLLAERFEAEALATTPFLDRLVASEDLTAAIVQMTRRICELAPLAVEGMKQSIAEISRTPPDHDAARVRIARCFASSDHAEALRARADKRAPVFKGE